jgi:hypothetical protein
MWSIADVAARDGVSKPTVSIRVKRSVERQGLTVERESQGRVMTFNVAEYDALRGIRWSRRRTSAPTPFTNALLTPFTQLHHHSARRNDQRDLEESISFHCRGPQIEWSDLNRHTKNRPRDTTSSTFGSASAMPSALGGNCELARVFESYPTSHRTCPMPDNWGGIASIKATKRRRRRTMRV